MLLSTVTGEQQYIKASAKYFAVALRGGGDPMAVCRLDRHELLLENK
jgi:coronin-1B/1C/6